MNPRFPLKDVTIKQVPISRKVEAPVYADELWQMNQTEFAMKVDRVGSFYACDGNYVEYSPHSDATSESVELYLNGSVYGAILHQRRILPLHGSSFIENGKGILICGDSGAGKSSVTASFMLRGAVFLTDDVTPVVLNNNSPEILPLSDRIKLWEDSLDQLSLKKEGLNRIDPETKKFYFPVDISEHSSWPLNSIFIINISQERDPEFVEVKGAEKVTTLRKEIYRTEYLAGMPENEIIYFRQLVEICKKIRIFKVFRHTGLSIDELRKRIRTMI